MAKEYDKGDLVRCSGTFKDSSNELIDPTVVKFDFTAPGEDAVTYTYATDLQLVKDSTGLYHVDVDAAMAGTWFYRFYSTGTGQAADEGSFVVKRGNF
jgi:hypothetical protein